MKELASTRNSGYSKSNFDKVFYNKIMITFYKSDDMCSLVKIDQPVPGCWINAVEPNEQEVRFLLDKIHVLPEFMKAALDPEETSHIDKDDDHKQTLIITDYPDEKDQEQRSLPAFITLPISVVFLEDYIVTISTRANPFITALESGEVRRMDTRLKTRFFLLLQLMIAQKYQTMLHQIEVHSERISERLYRRMNNRELLGMLELDKSLIYFSSSLKADDNTLQKIHVGRQIRLYSQDRELLDDVMIEFRQALDMCEIYTTVNSRVTEGCSNVISNNMNDIMKALTVITIVMSIPNMIYGFYGMNVDDLPIPHVWFPLLLSIVGCLACWLYFKHNRKFK